VTIQEILSRVKDEGSLELLDAQPLIADWGERSLADLWPHCERGDWLVVLSLGVLSTQHDRRGLVRAALRFADEVLPVVPIDVQEPRALRRAVEGWLDDKHGATVVSTLHKETLEAAERLLSSARFGPDLREQAAAACCAVTAASAIATRDLERERVQTMTMVGVALRRGAEAAAELSLARETDPVSLPEPRKRARRLLRRLDCARGAADRLQQLASDVRREWPVPPA